MTKTYMTFTEGDSRSDGGETIANPVMWAATPPLEEKVMTRTRQSRAKRAKDNENRALQAAPKAVGKQI